MLKYFSEVKSMAKSPASWRTCAHMVSATKGVISKKSEFRQLRMPTRVSS
jgi:hypothetical protein